MSQENQGLPIAEAWNAIGDFDADALVALCDPSVTFESRITSLEAATYEGHEGLRRYIANLAAAFEWIEVERSNVVEKGDRAVVTNHFRARGRGSGIQVQQQFFMAMKGREGKVLWWGFFDLRSDALEAVRLRE